MSDPEKIDVLAQVLSLSARAKQRIDRDEVLERVARRNRLAHEERMRTVSRDPRVGIPQGPELIARALTRGTGKVAAVCREVYGYARGSRKPPATATLWLIGPPGTGKTTSAVRLVLHHEASGRSALYVRAPVLPAIRNYGTAEVYDRVRRTDLLVVDEIGTEIDPKVLVNLVLERHDCERLTVLVGNLAPNECVERYQLMTDLRMRSRMAQLRARGMQPVRSVRDTDHRTGETQ